MAALVPLPLLACGGPYPLSIMVAVEYWCVAYLYGMRQYARPSTVELKHAAPEKRA
jgi:hypothetical protein